MTPKPIDSSVLEASVSGRHLQPGPFREQLGPRPTLVIFLRHLGCLFCREWISEIRQATASDPSFPACLFIHLGTPEQGDAYFSSVAPDARVVSDPSQALYKEFGVPRASVLQLLDPRVWACGIRATRKGHKSGRPIGDPFVMPALALVEGNQVTWKFVPDHMGGLPRLEDIPRPVVV